MRLRGGTHDHWFSSIEIVVLSACWSASKKGCEAAERCWEAGKLRIPKGGAVRVLLADLSLLCEAADTAGWSPAETWTPTPRLDSYPQGCAPAP